MKLNKEWSVCCGENSKEVDVQNNRIKREKEVFYSTILEIPQNPKDPWDREMDYDDSLTPEIPIEQPPDEDDDMVVDPQSQVAPDYINTYPANTSTVTDINNRMPEPDLELLAVLLKNPQIVFALTAGQGGSLTNEQTVKLLDAIKANAASGGSINTLVNGLVERKTEETVEVSLPSPTPSSNPVTSGGWRSESSKNHYSGQTVAVNGDTYPIPGVYFHETTPQQAISPVTHQRLPDVVLDHRNISNLVTDRRHFPDQRFPDTVIPDRRYFHGPNASSDAYSGYGPYGASQLQHQAQVSDHVTNYGAYGTGELGPPVRSYEYNGWDYSDPNDRRNDNDRWDTSRMQNERTGARYGDRGGRNDGSRWRDRRR